MFGAVSGASSNTAAKITGLSFEGDSLVLRFVGADTNRVEACNDQVHWFAWDDCGGWTYAGATGRVTVSNAQETCWYRVVSAGSALEWTETAVVSYAPLYIGVVLSNANLAATRGDVDLSIATALASLSGGGLPPVGWVDNMDPAPTNVAWSIGTTGSYFKALSVGGEVQVGNRTFLDTGTLSLNGTAISDWNEITAGKVSIGDVAAYVSNNILGRVNANATEIGKLQVATNSLSKRGIPTWSDIVAGLATTNSHHLSRLILSPAIH